VKITKKLREMKDADAHFVSLVTRSANRIPIRIMKRDKENHMLDLTSISRVLKREADARVPEVTALVVEKTDKFEAVKAAIQEAGLSVDNIVDNPDGSALIVQKSDPEDGSTVIRMNDHVVALVRNMPELDVHPALKADGFLHGPAAAQEMAAKLAKKSEYSDAQEVIDYARVLTDTIPQEAQAAAEAVAKAERVSQGGTLNDPKVLTTGSMTDGEKTPAPTAGGAAQVQGSPEPLATDSGNAGASDSVPKDGPAGFDKGVWETMTAEQKLAILNWSSQGAQKAEKCNDGAAAVAAAPAAAAPVEEEDEEEKEKAMVAAMKAAVEPLAQKLNEFGAQLQSVVKAQKEQGAQVAALSQKSEGIEKAVKSTVVAAPRGGDAPAGGSVTVQKSSDPRSGCFDTAFIRHK
jgi:hypothetical protein